MCRPRWWVADRRCSSGFARIRGVSPANRRNASARSRAENLNKVPGKNLGSIASGIVDRLHSLEYSGNTSRDTQRLKADTKGIGEEVRNGTPKLHGLHGALGLSRQITGAYPYEPNVSGGNVEPAASKRIEPGEDRRGRRYGGGNGRDVRWHRRAGPCPCGAGIQRRGGDVRRQAAGRRRRRLARRRFGRRA